MVSADADPPVDRPNLSKDYLAGEAQETGCPCGRRNSTRAADRTRARARRRSTRSARRWARGRLATGYGALLIASGADPVHLPVPERAALPVLYLRSLADGRAIVGKAAGAKRASSSAPASSVLKSPRRCASAASRSMSWRPKLPLERVMGAELAVLSRGLTNLTGRLSPGGRRSN